MEIPIITIQLQGMQQHVRHAFLEYQLDLTKNVEQALDAAIKNFDFNSEVQKVAFEVLREQTKSAVQSAIWKAFNHEIREQVLVPLIKEIMIRSLTEDGSKNT